LAIQGNVLVTGGRGFIGKNVVKSLEKLDSIEKIYSVDISPIGIVENNKSEKVIQIVSNLASETEVQLLPDKVDYVFALAAVNGTSRFYSEPFYVLYNSILPTVFVIKKYAGSAQILYSSSSEVYSCGVELGLSPVPTAEDVPIVFSDLSNPRWSYGSSKALGEFAMHAAAREFGCVGTIVRYHNVFGPDMGKNHFVPDFVEKVISKDFTILGAEQTRSFIFVDDAVEATILAISKASSEIPCYHIGTNNEISILDAGKIILDLMGIDESELKLLPAPIGSVSRRCPSVKKLMTEFNWRPEIDFVEGLRRYIEWRLKRTNE
jgi:nucleoside-diphosphate-sugar epimerase